VPVPPPGFHHGRIAVEIASALRDFVSQKKLGAVTIHSGFWISRDPDTVRGPDVAFVRAERVPAGGVRAFFEGVPDLAVEVIPPSDHASEVNAKVWVVDPDTQSVTVYSHRFQARILTSAETLTSEELLPGFCLPIGQIFINP
jgi:Uma2 family endonuclease